MPPAALAQHSSSSVLWYSPMPVVDRARKVLHIIDLDPASDNYGNSRVQAQVMFERRALERDWQKDMAQHPLRARAGSAKLTRPRPFTVFLNPPGGTVKVDGDGRAKSQASLFWQKLMYHYLRGHVSSAIFVAFSLEQLQTSQGKALDASESESAEPASIECPSICAFPFCVPSKRLRFDPPALSNAAMAPTHANAIVYLPPYHKHRDEYIKSFAEHFQDLGDLCNV